MRDLIIRYKNRKLYSFNKHRYLTLNDIKNYVNLNKQFVIKQSNTNMDITAKVLAKVFISNVKSTQIDKIKTLIKETYNE